MTALIETTPKMDLAIRDIEHMVEELRAYHAIYSPLLQYSILRHIQIHLPVHRPGHAPVEHLPIPEDAVILMQTRHH